MIEFYLNYRATIFTDTIEATNINIQNLLKEFSEMNLLPNVYSEIVQSQGVIGPTAVQSLPISVFELKNLDNTFTIKFGQNRIDFLKLKQNPNGDIGSISEFIANTINCFDKIANLFKCNSNRIALGSNAIFSKMNNDQLNKIYSKICTSIPTHSNNIPFEWNIRQASNKDEMIQGKSETLNLISNLSRGEVTINNNGNIEKSSRLIIELDINTSPTNNEKRFTLNHISEYLTQSISIHKTIIDEYTILLENE